MMFFGGLVCSTVYAVLSAQSCTRRSLRIDWSRPRVVLQAPQMVSLQLPAQQPALRHKMLLYMLCMIDWSYIYNKHKKKRIFYLSMCAVWSIVFAVSIACTGRLFLACLPLRKELQGLFL